MPEIILTDVTKRWGNFYAVEHLDLKIENNAFITLLGPSGCGKTTTLRMIAGLETPTSGRIVIGDRVVFDSEMGINIPPNKRKVGFLFQNYALWPNMTVYQNISFGLTNIKEVMPQISFEARVAKRIAEIVADWRKIADITNDCLDKKGQINKDKLYLKLIDTYIISLMTAKKLAGYGFNTAENPQSKADEVIAEMNKIIENERQVAAKKGCSLNDEFEYVKDGEVVKVKRKLSKEEVDLSVRRVSRIVKIGMFMDRYPAELSGGQQQRVAIARTLAPEPTVLFMDEPLSNLDAKLRLEMRSELQRLHVDTGSTFVYVTHDQMEAMTLATSICLIDNGVLQQYDAPLTVYNRPNNTFVADFVGNPSINFVEANGQSTDEGVKCTVWDGQQLNFVFNDKLDVAEWCRQDRLLDEQKEQSRQKMLADKRNVEKGNKDVKFKCHIAKVDETEIEEERELTDNDFIIGIRPEAVKISNNGAIEGEIYSAMPTGMETTVRIKIGEYLITGVIFGGVTYQLGQKVKIDFDGDGIMLFGARSGRFICSGSIAKPKTVVKADKEEKEAAPKKKKASESKTKAKK